MTDTFTVGDDRPRAVRPPRFELIPLSQIRVHVARNYLVKGIIPRRGLVVLYGPPKCGKSFWVFDLVMHIALGWPYRGRRVQQGAVVYLVMEGQDGFRNRVEAFRQMMLVGGDDVPVYLLFTSVDLIRDHGELIKNIRSQLGPVTPACVVIDTLNRTLVGSESKDEDMANYLRGAGAIEAAFDCAVPIVHHSGLEAGRPRGHTSLTGAADVQISVVRDGANNVVATVERMKDGPEGEVLTSRLESVEVGQDEDGDSITSCVVREVEGVRAGAKKAGVKIPKGAANALLALHDCLNEHGKEPPASPHIPSKVKAVTVDQWLDYALRKGLTHSDKADSQRRALDRATTDLVAAKQIGVWKPYVWPVYPTGPDSDRNGQGL